MSQTTGSITAKNMVIEVSEDGTNWTDISGSASSVEPGGGERMKGEAHTFSGDTPVIGIGKRESVSLTLKFIYTEEDGECADLINDYYTNGTKVYLRYMPKGNTVGNWVFTGEGYFLSSIAPALDAGSGDIITVEVEWFGVELEQSVYST